MLTIVTDVMSSSGTLNSAHSLHRMQDRYIYIYNFIHPQRVPLKKNIDNKNNKRNKSKLDTNMCQDVC